MYNEVLRKKKVKISLQMFDVQDWADSVDPTIYGHEFERPHSSIITLVPPANPKLLKSKKKGKPGLQKKGLVRGK
jgi:hypothetical protein